jgi:hypothetical protein
MIRVLLGICGAASGLRLRLGGDDPIIQPIVVDAITTEDNTPVGGNENKPPEPSPYMANPPDTYQIDPVLESAVGNGELTVKVTNDDIDLCSHLIGQARVEAGCLGKQ